MAGMKHGAWCHIEIPTANPKAAKKFYGGMFGWEFHEAPEMSYTIYQTGDGEIGGGLWDPPAGTPRRITNYVNVDDLEASAKQVPKHGGKVLTERMEAGSHGSFRIVSDPDGNVFALWQTAKPAAARKPAPKGKPAASMKAAPKKKAKAAAKKKKR